MTDKITLTDLVNLQNETTAVNAINTNNDVITAAFNNTLSRDGSQPNQMGSSLDMNSNRILNLPSPVSGLEPFRLEDAQNLIVAQAPTVLQSNVFASVNAVTLSNISGSITSLRVAGFYTPGDGGEALYKKVVTPDAGVFNITSADGAKWQLAEQIVSVLMTGAVGNGNTDDSAAINSAITSAYFLGGFVVLPNRPYFIASPLNITQEISIRGIGIGGNSTIYAALGINAIVVNTTVSITLENFSIVYASAAPAGTAAISITSSTQNTISRISNVYISNAWIGINFIAAEWWVVRDCYFQNIGLYGISVSNTYQVDAGDGIITGCSFISCATAAIAYNSSSGLRISNNKIIQGAFGIIMQWNGTQSINGTNDNNGADFFILNNSIEQIGDTCIVLNRADTSSQFGTVIITGNELQGNRGILSAPSSPFISNLVISNNVYLGPLAVAGTFATLLYVRGFAISNNLIQSLNSGTIIIGIDANSDQGVIGPNAKFGPTVSSVISSTNTTTISPT